MTTIAIITAMDSEFNAILSLYDFKEKDGVMTTNIYNHDINLIKSGIGKVNAAIATSKAINNGADIVITTGLAGGIDDSLNQGDIVLANKVCYHDVWCGKPNQKGQVQDFPLYYTLDEKLIHAFQDIASKQGFKWGLTVTGDQFLTDVNRLKEIKSDFSDALAVDMESSSVAQTCYVNKKSFISLRIISDVVGKPNQVEQYNNFWQNMPKIASSMVDDILKVIPVNY